MALSVGLVGCGDDASPIDVGPTDVGPPDAMDAGAGDAELPPSCLEDMCGVCDDDPTNDCVQDCAGDWGGAAAEDMCGVCDTDPADDCVQDCAGDWGGSAMPDMCGVCDEDPSNDCVQDCNEDWGGSATEDMCGTCDADASNDCDCAMVAGGSSTVDMCGVCDADASNDCTLDCAGDWGGAATLDGCGTCDTDPSNDCTDDCNGVAGGPARLDMCMTCDEDPANDCTLDCAGDWGGDALEDMCGTCDTNAANDCTQDCAGAWGGDAVEDMCGTCDSDASNDCTEDCAGEFGGSAVLDACGRCTGGTSGAVACPTVTLSPVADSYVSASQPGSNYGDDNTMFVSPTRSGSERRVFMRFDLSSLPDGAVVRGVQLTAHAYGGYAYGGDGNVYTQFVEDDSWGETAINWGNQPSTDGTNLGHWWLWYNGTPSDREGVNDSDLLVPVIQREHAGDGMVSFRLSSSGYDTNYHSREASDAADHPQLVVGYLPSTTVTPPHVADAWVEGTTSGNHGTDMSLEVTPYSDTRTFLQFDLGAVPAGAEVVEATLQMTAYDGYAYGGNGNVYTHLVTDDTWTESTITGANQPDVEAEALGFWWLWYNFDAVDRVGTLSTEAFRAAIQTEADGDRVISLRLHSSGYWTAYRSREYGTESQRPVLSVRYVMP